MIYTLEQLEAIQYYLYKRGANDEKINDLIKNYEQGDIDKSD